ncbi:Uu.00g124540.m01.CDS01 [Anthostomella pinea]|uniref:Uu.00g124540.m01.CDS01 n=1 Tax=Anthostomella pinea TaxID=933095 RepID=A0AAI8VHL3_9PEZI|nr:Uu.00g124540.m01.CDS01 [Anthostomella pinea]
MLTLCRTSLSRGQLVTESFHQFSQLAPELRRSVWRASWAPRNIVVFHNNYPNEEWFANSNKGLPASAFVNRESRDETLLHFAWSFARFPIAAPIKIRINFNINILFVASRDCQPRLTHELKTSPELRCLQQISVREWLPVGLLSKTYAHHWPGVWGRAKFLVPRLRNRSQLREQFAGSFHNDVQSALHVTQCLLASHFPALREITLRPLGPENFWDECHERLWTEQWFELKRHTVKSIEFPRLKSEGDKTVRVNYSPLKYQSTGCPQPLNGFDWRCLSYAMEYALGCDGFQRELRKYEEEEYEEEEAEEEEAEEEEADEEE